MTYHGPLFGKIGRKFIPLKLTAEDVDRLTTEIEQLRKWTSTNGVLALVDERDHWKAEAERWRIVAENAQQDQAQADTDSIRALHERNEARAVAKMLTQPIPQRETPVVMRMEGDAINQGIKRCSDCGIWNARSRQQCRGCRASLWSQRFEARPSNI